MHGHLADMCDWLTLAILAATGDSRRRRTGDGDGDGEIQSPFAGDKHLQEL